MSDLENMLSELLEKYGCNIEFDFSNEKHQVSMYLRDCTIGVIIETEGKTPTEAVQNLITKIKEQG